MIRPSDTTPAAAAFQIDLLREALPSRRARLALDLSDTVIALARKAIGRAHPDLNESERGILFVEIHYGRELAERLRRHLRINRHAI